MSDELALGWSPTGDQLVWNVEGERDALYLGPFENPRKRFLTGNAYHPAWSPDGKYLALVEPAPGCNGGTQISIYDAATAARVRTVVGSSPDNGCFGSSHWPDWSPDGRRIVFAGTDPAGKAGYDVYVVGVDGNRRRRLTRTEAKESSPKWSPDGRRIAYMRSRRNYYHDLYLMRPDGSRKRELVRRVLEVAWQRLPKR